MACYHPIYAWRRKNVDKPDKILFSWTFGTEPLTLPCGQCIGCRLERSRQWAMRCMHESQLHKDNCFITLTYNPANLPEFSSLKLSDFQKFLKRFRKSIAPARIRFYHCGEYGTKNQRPHYHAIIFGYDFKDKQPYQRRFGNPLFVSAELEKLWPLGYSTIGAVSFQSAAYVARYIMKKINGEKSLEHYHNFDKDTGELYSYIKPEYTTMSRRPGIAAGWYNKYQSDIYPSDYITLKGSKMKPPKYYDTLYQHDEPEKMQKIKDLRELKAQLKAHDNTPERLQSRELVAKAKLNLLHRPL